MTGKDCALHVDPVFLLDAAEWSKLAKDPGIDNYILIYRLNKSNIIDNFARELAKKTGKKVINIGQDLIDKVKIRILEVISALPLKNSLVYSSMPITL